ncbi:MAG: BAB2_0123 family type IV secretion system effector [Phyllobacterium sp.]
MSLLLASSVSLALVAGGAGVFFVSLRKAQRIMKLSREVAHQVAHSAASLDHALATLQAERDAFSDEGRRLEAKLKDSDRACKYIDEAVSLVARVKGEIQDDVRALQKGADTHRHARPVPGQSHGASAAPAQPLAPVAMPAATKADFQASFAAHLAAARASTGKTPPEQPKPAERAKLPVFVNRIVRSADIAAAPSH